MFNKEKRIPTILAIFFLVIGIFSGVFLIKNNQVFLLRASPEITPNQVKITNISSSSFTVSWITDKETSGFVQFGETPSLGQTFADDRDQVSGSTGNFQTHHVTLKNLKPKTIYFFKISSGGKIFDNSGKPYEVTTAPVIPGTPPPSDVVSGIILKQDGTPAEGVIVYLSLTNTTPQSTLVRSSGSFVIPLNTALSSNLSNYATYDKEAQILEIFVQGASLGASTIITTTKNDNPIPEITLGRNYDFRQTSSLQSNEKTPLLPTSTPSQSENQATPSSKFPFEEIPISTGGASPNQITIISPEQNEKVATSRPEIIGSGPANQTLQITIESPIYTGTVKTNKNGEWNFIPPEDLAPGTHTIKVSYGGKTISRTFTVLAAGENTLPAFTASPSATLTPTPTLTLTPTPVATSSPTPSPRTSRPSTESGIPTSGYLTPTFLLFTMGIVLLFGGLFFLSLIYGKTKS